MAFPPLFVRRIAPFFSPFLEKNQNSFTKRMLRDTLFTESDSQGLLHPLVASRILHLYEMKHHTEVELLNGLIDQGYDKEFRIERLKTVFCPQVKRRVEKVISSCVLKVSELRILYRDRQKNFMALVEASWSALKGGGSSCGGGRNEEGGENQCKKRGRRKSAGALSAGSSRATPKSRRNSSNARNENAGNMTGMSVTPTANEILPQPSSSNGDGETSRAEKRRRSLDPGDDAKRSSGRTPSRSTPRAEGLKPGSISRRLSKKDKKAVADGNLEGREPVRSSLDEEVEKNNAGEKATVALAVKVSSDAETRRGKWLAAVEENDRRFEEVEERVRREIAKAEELHRARNLELFRWSVDEQRGKHVGWGSQGPPPMSIEPGDSIGDPSISSSAVVPSSVASAMVVDTESIPDARLRADKYLRAVEENDVRLRNRQEHLKNVEELAKKAHHARSLELFAWDVEERMGKHGALGSDGPPAIV